MKAILVVSVLAAILGCLAFVLLKQISLVPYQLIFRDLARSQIILTTEGSVEYYQKGEGPFVLVIHGSPGGFDQSEAVIDHLLNDSNHFFTFLAISRPGYLKSSLNSRGDPDALTRWYAAFLDEMNIEKVGIVAIGAGIPSALRFVEKHADQCWSLTLLEGFEPSTTVGRSFFESSSIRQMVEIFLRGNDLLSIWLARWADISAQLRGDAADRQFSIDSIYSTAFGSMRKSGMNVDSTFIPNLIKHQTEKDLRKIVSSVSTLHICSGPCEWSVGGDDVWTPSTKQFRMASEGKGTMIEETISRKDATTIINTFFGGSHRECIYLVNATHIVL